MLIVDDSAVARTVIARMLSEHGFDVAGQAASADAALALLGTMRVDIILLDLEMPGVDGLAVLPALIAQGQGARVLVVSSACAGGGEGPVAALRLGAVDTMLKPGAVAFTGRFFEELSERIRRIARPAGTWSVSAAPSVRAVSGAAAIGCIGIGASTGGVHALAAFLGTLPRHVTAPILITQHLPAPFMPYFVAQLGDMAGRPVRLAAQGMEPRPGEVMLAPGDGSLSLARLGQNVHVRIERVRAASGCLPSVDPMLAAIGKVYGVGAVGVMLSGMGRDGVAGAKILVAKGGTMWAQDAESSVVWGMPGAVANAGLAHHVLPPAAIASAIGEHREGAARWR